MASLSTDARMVLEYLNELGYQNITAQQLKEFIIDLRKLIKYEHKIGVHHFNDNFFEQIHKKSTVSSRARTRDAPAKATTKKTISSPVQQIVESRPTKTIQSSESEEIVPVRESRQVQPSKASKPVLSQPAPDSSKQSRPTKPIQSSESEEIVPVRESRQVQPSKASKPVLSKPAPDSSKPKGVPQPHTTTRLCQQEEKKKDSVKSTKTTESTDQRPPTKKMWIRPIVKKPQNKPPEHDPVALYHYYQKEWEKFKHCLPGENSHSELRWEIRQKLLGAGVDKK